MTVGKGPLKVVDPTNTPFAQYDKQINDLKEVNVRSLFCSIMLDFTIYVSLAFSTKKENISCKKFIGETEVLFLKNK